MPEPNISRNGSPEKPLETNSTSLKQVIARRLAELRNKTPANYSGPRPLKERLERLQDLFERIKPVPEEWLTPPQTHSKTGISFIPFFLFTAPTLGQAAYHGIIGSFLGEVADYTEATDAGVLAHLLPAIGMYIGPKPFMWAGTNQPTRLNAIVVGPTSTGRKGTSFVPVDLLMRHMDEVFWGEQHVRGLSSGEGLIAKVADHREWNKEAKLWEIEPVEKRLFVQEPEFSRVLIQSQREGNILSQVLRETFDSGKLGSLTKNNPIQVENAHVCIVGHITPEELQRRFSDIEMANGFGNRFLWFAVRSEKIMPHSEPIPEQCIEKYAIQFKKAIEFASEQERVEMDKSIHDYWSDIYASLRKDQPGFAGMVTARGESIVQRIALIYALIDQSPQVCQQHLEAGLAVWDYNIESAKLLFNEKTGNELADKIYQLLTIRPLKNSDLHPHFKATGKEINDALTLLETNNRIQKVTIKREGSGRPATQWEVVDPIQSK